jgi:SHS2 domain-containing protein
MYVPSDADYFDHDADIGVIGHGHTLEQAFVNVAYNTFAIMCDLTQIKPLLEINVSFKEKDIELALVQWINLLLSSARENGLMFSHFELLHHQNIWTGKACGASWQPQFEHGVEVKGATLTMLSVKQEDNEYTARCVVDV